MWMYCVFLIASMSVTVRCQDCNFDDNGTLVEKMCNWGLRLNSGGYNWIHITGPTPNQRTGPIEDHSRSGGYMYAPGGEPQDDGSITPWPKGTRTHLVGPILQTLLTPKVVQFYYFMYGTDIGILNVFVIVKGRKSPKPQWRKTGDKGNQWKLGEVTIPSNSTARIVFEAVPTRHVAGDIAIDDITFSDMAIDCDFEGEVPHPSCHFTQSTDDQFNWMPNSGKTPTKKTGPPVDHTRGTSKGVYMFMESTGINLVEGDTCVLFTTRFQKEVGPCFLNFFYYMQGSQMGSLYVHLVTEQEVVGTILWSMLGDQGGTWREANVNLTNVSGPYSIAFKGIRGDGHMGDIAIDDIKLLGQQCLNEDVMPALENGDTYWDYCDSSPCINNGTCITRAGDYNCLCSEAWTGNNCETEVPEGPCRSQPCMNGGTCNQTETNGTLSYNCLCLEYYDGEVCDIDLDATYCESQPCLNGATCELTANGYRCLCTDAWNGTHCESDIDECSLSICLNGGNCTNTQGGFNCTCPSEWHGQTCENECEDSNTHCPYWSGIDECSINPSYMLIYCKESCGVCGNYACSDNVDSCRSWAELGECDKNPFYMLAHCHVSCQVCIDDECRSNPCLNLGTCIDGDDSFTCLCADGYSGVNCENDTDECTSSPCQNNATCVDGINGYTCNCTELYDGTDCEHRKDHCFNQPCQNNGNCTNTEDSYSCICQPGFEGDYCETNIDECASSPCDNGGFCIDKDNGFLCNCTEAWVGVTCDTDFDECKSNPCQHGGLCYHGIGESLFFCDCRTGWTGDNCSVEVDECESTPCLNGGTCTDALHRYTCTCTDGYTGMNCEAELLECASDPCQNGAQCVDKVGSFSCLCLEGYEGDLCQYDINECHSSPCQNGGTCEDLPNGHLCQCTNDYTGRYCEIEVRTTTRVPVTTKDTKSTSLYSHDYYSFLEDSEIWDFSYVDPVSDNPSTSDMTQSKTSTSTTPGHILTTEKEVTSLSPSTTVTTITIATRTQVRTSIPPIFTSTSAVTTSSTSATSTTTSSITTTAPTTTVTHTTTLTPTTTAPTTRISTTPVAVTISQMRTNQRQTTPSTSARAITTPTSPTPRRKTTTPDSKKMTPGKPTKDAQDNTIPSREVGTTIISNGIDYNDSIRSGRPKSDDMMTIITVGIIAFILIVILIIAVVIYRRYQQRRTRIYEQFDMESKEDSNLEASRMSEIEPAFADPVDSNSFSYSPM